MALNQGLSEQNLFETDEPASRNPIKANALVNVLWPAAQESRILSQSLLAYSNYHRDQCYIAKPSVHALHTLQEVSFTIDYVNHNPTATKEEIIQSLSAFLSRTSLERAELENSLHLIMRLWLMINIRSITDTEPISLETTLVWPRETSISDVIKPRFQVSSPAAQVNARRFSKTLTAASLEKIGGFHIGWTDNLIDHLALKDNNILYLFYNVSVLLRMKKTISSKIIPPTVFDETLDTLSLLIPRTDQESRRWLEVQQRNHRLDPDIELLQLASRDVSHYDHWRERLLLIQEAFEETEPSTLSQWWYDRRKKVQWYTFWVAILVLILTIIFGLIQSVTGVIQAWVSIRSM